MSVRAKMKRIARREYAAKVATPFIIAKKAAMDKLEIIKKKVIANNKKAIAKKKNIAYKSRKSSRITKTVGILGY